MTIVHTRDGDLRGEDLDGCQRFRGVPYAAPPVGDGRWKATQPPEPWDGVRDALDFGPIAPQPPGGAQFIPAGVAQSEDCLTLNVWTPSTEGVRPVMVWFHGGGFRQGSSSSPLYEGEALARHGDVVVVTVNYRLGALGFCAHPDLRDGEGGPAGNWGLLDLLESLRWVRDNAGAFGGDPANVTVFGESAGAACVSVLLATPASEGLFHRAVAQSGAAFAMSTEAGARAAERLCDAAGVETVAGLRDLSAEQIVAAQVAVDGGGGTMRFLPAVDGHLFDELPIEQIREGTGVDVPTMIGTNRDEWKLWAPADPRSRDLDEAGLRRRLERRLKGDVDEVIDTFRTVRTDQGLAADPPDLWFAIETERFFRVPAVELADALAARVPTWVYLFTWGSPAMKGWLGACHGLEIAFVFGNQGRAELSAFTGEGPDADRLAETMMNAWVAFARDGDPSAAMPDWEPYGPSRPTMIFDAESALALAPDDEVRAVVAANGASTRTRE